MKKLFNTITYHPFFIRLMHWEYWPFHVVYGLIYPIFIWYMIKARSFIFYSASNPTIENGGFLMESKKKIYDLIPDAYKPFTLYYEAGTEYEYILQEIHQHQLAYPLIIKPDIGGMGKGVMKVNNNHELKTAILKFPFAFIIQPFIYFEKEIGLFYVRYPNQTKGKITGIVDKDFLKVKGDGIHTIKELLLQNKRYVLQMDAVQKLCASKLHIVLKKDEEEVLIPFGNHARGSLFLDATHWVDENFENNFDAICKQIDGFYYGRLDIKYESLELLKQGKNFSIIELNGAGSEPTHIYDPKHSLFFAWKEIIRHWKMLYEISMLNKKGGIEFMTFADWRLMFKNNATYQKKLATL